MTEQQKLKMLAGLVEHGDAFRFLSGADAQWVIENTVSAIGVMVAAIKGRDQNIVRLISGTETIMLDPTDGNATIAHAVGVFSYVDPDFKNYGTNIAGITTENAKVTVHEMIKDGTFAQIFGGMSGDLDSLCLTQPQIIQFVQDHRKWLRADRYGIFFLFKVGSEFFVAYVSVSGDGQLKVNVYRFSFDRVWGAEYRHRVVVPQLTPKN